MGDRAALLDGAVDELRIAGVVVSARSPVYETAPQGDLLDQPDFFNAVVRIETAMTPEDLLATCKQIEQNFGRQPGPRHAPRPLDIDVLLLGDLQVESPLLDLPHRDLANRRFVLEPLKDLVPGLILPGGQSIDDRLAAVHQQQIRRVGVPGWPWDAASDTVGSSGMVLASTLTVPLGVTLFAFALAVAVNELWNPLAAALLAAPVLTLLMAVRAKVPVPRAAGYGALSLLATTAWIALAIGVLALVPGFEFS